MRFGIFGSAQARRGGPDVDSGSGFRDFVEYNVEAEALASTAPSSSSITSPASARSPRR
jgi:hypothetical protein